MVRRFERMIIQVSGHYVSLEQLNWLRRIVREERHMYGSLSVPVLLRLPVRPVLFGSREC